ncbi:hypothetical protein [Gemmatimonas sp.]|jgi:hypothetical protein|uniref:hypothetical protein n=1 Tax=Gemmatimonas sp. TaxID=1962908 RepID=UPI0037BE47A0
MPNPRVREVLYESEAALRLVDQGITGLTDMRNAADPSATDHAALSILDACDRATRMIDDLDTIDAAETPDRDRAADTRGALRDELSRIMGALHLTGLASPPHLWARVDRP